ncbi:MAG: HupE/UreJ family protein [Deltaproteobacteria bacterium]|nr:HupE/UreJ family protein [Deltaproteobacteria bacterium]MCK5709984.1 HupE/UreJ family protein [Deltaproteobacteria bacterium]
MHGRAHREDPECRGDRQQQKADVLVRVELLDGRSLRHVLTAGAPSYIIPERESALSVIKGYLTLGFFHILDGLDHLLFLIGIVLIVRWRRMLLWTVTAFTVGHSITLALAVLGLVNIPQQITEAAIALSIYFLGIELVRSYRTKNTLMDRYPWIIAGLFGLLHGLGFAGALSEVGLPQTDIPLALFSFNIGIEAGQLLFLGAVVLVWAAFRRLPFSWPAFVKYIPAYAIGSLAALWFLERIWNIL